MFNTYAAGDMQNALSTALKRMKYISFNTIGAEFRMHEESLEKF